MTSWNTVKAVRQVRPGEKHIMAIDEEGAHALVTVEEDGLLVTLADSIVLVPLAMIRRARRGARKGVKAKVVKAKSRTTKARKRQRSIRDRI